VTRKVVSFVVALCAGLSVALVAPVVPVLAKPPINVSVPSVIDPSILAKPTTGPAVAQGHLMDQAGHPATGFVAVIAWPGPQFQKTVQIGQAVTMPTIGWTASDPTGAYVVHVDPALIPAGYFRDDHGVNMELVSWDGVNLGTTWAPSPALAPSNQSSTMSGQSAETSGSSQSIPTVNLSFNAPLTAQSSLSGSTAATDAVAQGGPPYIYRCNPTWTLMKTYTAYATVSESQSAAATNYASVGYNHSVTLGAAEEWGSGAWALSGSESETSGVTFTYAESLADRSFQVQYLNGTYRDQCPGTYVYWSGALYPTGGYAAPARQFTYAANYCVSVPAGLWTRSSSSGSSYTNSVGFKTDGGIGIDLNVSSNYTVSDTTTSDLSYRFSKTSTLCGDNNYPASASHPNVTY
jgi:hypothetical protein